MKAAGLIAAAGLSSRMEDFKPLMELNGFPMIAMTVRSMRNAGIRNITVVTGFRGEEVRKVLDPWGFPSWKIPATGRRICWPP